MTAGYNNGNSNGGGSLTNNGTVVWGGSAIYGYGGAVIHNAGLWQTFGDYSLSTQAGTNTFFNTGTFQKTGGSGSASFTWRFNTTGTVNTTSANLNINQWNADSTLHGTLNLAGTTRDRLVWQCAGVRMMDDLIPFNFLFVSVVPLW